MKQIKTIIVLALIGFSVGACSITAPTVVGYRNPSIKQSSKGGLGLDIQLNVNNPNNNNIRVTKIQAEVISNGRVIATVSNDNKITLRKNTQEFYTVSLSTNAEPLNLLLSGVSSLLNGPNIEIKGFGVAKMFGIAKRFDFDSIEAQKFLRFN